MKYELPTKSRNHHNKFPTMPATSRVSIVSYFSEPVLAVKIYNYLRGFQLISDRYGMQNLTKEEVTRLYTLVQREWGPGLTYQYPRVNDLEGVKKLFDMCDKWYEEMDSTTDNVMCVFHYYGY